MGVGVWLGSMLGIGMLLVASGWRRYRHPSVVARVQPYVRDVRPDLASLSRARWQPHAVHLLDRVLGGRASVERRLSRLGRGSGSVDRFRLRQLVWTATGFGSATALALLIWSVSGGNPALLLAVCGIGALAGAIACDHDLTMRVNRRERSLREELPVAAELLALTVAAGESPLAGLERVGQVMSGALADEVGDVLSHVKTGS